MFILSTTVCENILFGSEYDADRYEKVLDARWTASDLQRLDAVSRSPIQAALAEGLEGSTTIKAYRKNNFFANMNTLCTKRRHSVSSLEVYLSPRITIQQLL